MLKPINEHQALIYTMVLVAAANGEMSDTEMSLIDRIVRFLPIFRDFDRSTLDDVGVACANLLKQDEGFDVALGLIGDALSPELRETAYALACEVAAADLTLDVPELELLQAFRHGLNLDRLTAAAIERGTSARYKTL